jgi:ribokinase
MKRILVAGSSNTDLIIRVPEIPRPGETILGGEFLSAQGGKGANQAVAAARAGGAVSFIASVGDDDYGRKSIQGYRLDGIDTSRIKVCSGVPSGIALINVSAGGENAITVASGANHRLTPQDLRKAEPAFRQADILLVQLEIPYETVSEAIRIAAAHNLLVILNPAPAGDLPDEVLRKTDILTPNETEAEKLTGILADSEEAAGKACERLHRRGVKKVILTLGGKGAFISDPAKGIRERIPAFSVGVVDTTAAGDVFNGALAVALNEDRRLPEAVRFASAAAALSVGKAGAQSSIPSRVEIERFLKANI